MSLLIALQFVTRRYVYYNLRAIQNEFIKLYTDISLLRGLVLLLKQVHF